MIEILDVIGYILAIKVLGFLNALIIYITMYNQNLLMITIALTEIIAIIPMVLFFKQKSKNYYGGRANETV